MQLKNQETKTAGIKKLVICTTAIIRPDIHKISIGGFYDHINKTIDKYKIEIYHIINIDSPEKLVKLGASADITEKNLKELIPKYVNIFVNKTEKPNFLNACGNIIEIIKKNKLIGEEYAYFWFEDDWIICNTIINILDVVQFFTYPNTYINMTESVIGVTQPVIVGANLFKQFFIEAIAGDKNYDPEANVRNTLINYLNKEKKSVNIYFFEFGNFGNKYDKLYKECEDHSFGKYKNKIKSAKTRIIINDLTKIPKLDISTITSIIIHPIFFEDIGRLWSKKMQLVKWNKKNDTFTYH